MKNVIYCFIGIFILISQPAFSQKNQELNSEKQEKIEALEAQKDEVRQNEEEKLKDEVAQIDKRVEKGEIDVEEAENLKKQAVERYEQNIADQIEMIDLNISLIERNKNSDDYDEVRYILTDSMGEDWDDNEEGGFYVGLGGNIPLSGSGEFDPYKSLGWSFRLGILFGEFQLSPKNEKLLLKPGIDFHFLTMPMDDNNVLVDENNSTNVMELPENLDYSRFNVVNMNFPVHLEYGLKNDFNIGLGGFLGFKLYSGQEYEYELNNKFLHITRHRSFNTQNFQYGASAYFGWKELKLNAQYYISPVFQDSNANANNLSIGILFGY